MILPRGAVVSSLLMFFPRIVYLVSLSLLDLLQLESVVPGRRLLVLARGGGFGPFPLMGSFLALPGS